MVKRSTIHLVFLYLFVLMLLPVVSFAGDNSKYLSKRQLLYVPAYSHIYSGNTERPFLLAVTLSIRNVDPKHSIRITMVDYHDTKGKLERKYIESPIVLKPLETLRYVIPEMDTKGGSGANFMVEWEADILVNPPIVESIMIGSQTRQGVSFTSRGQEIFPTE